MPSGEKRLIHGLSRGSDGKHTRLFQIWTDIKSRCYNPRCKAYRYYGARGIIICDEWKYNYKAFHDWAYANGYMDNLTIERDNFNGNYEPSNCTWTTRQEQNHNLRSNFNITYNGLTLCISEWGRRLNLSPNCIRRRLKILPLEIAMTLKKRDIKSINKHKIK